MKISGATALVTGANRGLGLAFARALLEAGAAKVYAGARNPDAVALPGVIPLKLDVTHDADVAAAAREAADVTLLVNNAGIAVPGGFLADGAIEAARDQFEVNFFGPLRMARAFAPVLRKNGGGAIINVLSVASWMNGPLLATYGASKSAAWALTNGLRIELEGARHTGPGPPCRLHRHRSRARHRRAEEHARGDRQADARGAGAWRRPGSRRRDHPAGTQRSLGRASGLPRKHRRSERGRQRLHPLAPALDPIPRQQGKPP